MTLLSTGTYSPQIIIIGYLPLTEPIIVRNAGTEVELIVPQDTLRRKESMDVTPGPYGNDSAFSLSMQGTELRNLSTVMIDHRLRAVESISAPSGFTERGTENYLSAMRNQLRIQPYEQLHMHLNKCFV